MECGGNGGGHHHSCHGNDADGLVVVKQSVVFFYFYSLQGRILFLNPFLNGLRLLGGLSSINVMINSLYIMRIFFISEP